MKKLCLLLTVLLLLLTWCSCTEAESLIGGDPLSRDELPQEETPAMPVPKPDDLTVRTDVTMENVYYADDHIHYTLVNHTNENKAVAMYPYIQKKVGEQWQYLYYAENGWYALSIPANCSLEWSIPTRIAYTQTGEFRLILGDYATIEVLNDREGNQELAFKTNRSYIIGTLHLTEIDPPDVGTVTVVDGLPQNDLFYITDAYYADGYVYYTVVNQSDFAVKLKSKPRVQKRINGEWVSFGLYTEILGLAEQGISCRSSEDRRFRVVGVSEEDLSGEYRLFFGQEAGELNKSLSYSFTDEVFYIVGYLTIV